MEFKHTDKLKSWSCGRKSVYLKSRGFRISPEYVSVAGLHEDVHDCQALNFNGSLWLNVVPIVSALSTNELLSFYYAQYRIG